MTFVVHPQVVLRQADVAELVLRAPGARQRRLLLVHRRVEAPQPPLQLLLLLVQGRVPVREGGRRAAARRQRRGRAGARGEARGRGGRAGGGGGGGGGGRDCWAGGGVRAAGWSAADFRFSDCSMEG